MRELTVRLRFRTHSLGDVHDSTGRMLMPRNPKKRIVFVASRHAENVSFAAQVMGKHYAEVLLIRWDVQVDGVLRPDPWYRRYYRTNNGKLKYSEHEAFFPDEVVGINCMVPTAVSDADFGSLMTLAGKYRGLSPFRASDGFGLFEVESMAPMRPRL